LINLLEIQIFLRAGLRRIVAFSGNIKNQSLKIQNQKDFILKIFLGNQRVSFQVVSQEGRKFTLTSIPKVNPKIVSVDLSRKFTLA